MVLKLLVRCSTVELQLEDGTTLAFWPLREQAVTLSYDQAVVIRKSYNCSHDVFIKEPNELMIVDKSQTNRRTYCLARLNSDKAVLQAAS